MPKENTESYLPSGAVFANTLKVCIADVAMSVGISTLLYPLSTIWAIQQQQIKGIEGKYPTFLQACKQIRANKGWYAGFSVSAATAVPGTFAYLTGRSAAEYLFGNDTGGRLLQSPMGMACGMVFWSPGMRLQLLQQVGVNTQNTFYQRSAIETCKHIIARHGIRDLYRGTGAYFSIFSLNDFLGTYIQLCLLNQFSQKKHKYWSVQWMTTLAAFGVSSLVTIPLEAAVLPYMTQEIHGTAQKQPMLSLARGLFSKYGYRAFTRGISIGTFEFALWHGILPAKSMVKEYLTVEQEQQCGL